MPQTRGQKRSLDAEEDLQMKKRNYDIVECSIFLEQIENQIQVEPSAAATSNAGEVSVEVINSCSLQGTSGDVTQHSSANESQIQVELNETATSNTGEVTVQAIDSSSLQGMSGDVTQHSSANQNQIQVQPSVAATSAAGEVSVEVIDPIHLRGTVADVQWLPSNRKNQMILYSTREKQRYKKNKRNSAKGYNAMTCCVEKCPARIFHYDNGQCLFSHNFNGHNHSTTFEELIKVHKFKDNLKSACEKLEMIGGKLPSAKEVWEKQSDETNCEIAGAISFKAVENLCNRARRAALPKAVKTVEEIVTAFKNEYVYKTYALTHRNQDDQKSPFYRGAFQNEKGSSFCVFASNDIIQAVLANVEVSRRKIYVDGTFKICPHGVFKQVLVVFFELMGSVVPFAWVTTDGRDEASYTDVFNYLNEHVVPLECESFMSDYERALRNALQSVIPNAKSSSCWFHFTQACKRNAMKLPNLVNFLRDNSQAKQIYYELLCLPLLPADEIRKAFESIKVSALALNRSSFRTFLKYYENQWLEREGPDKISVFDQMNRSTGAVEATNRVMGKNIPPHAHFFRFLLSLRIFEWSKAKFVKNLVASGGQTGPEKKGKSKLRNAQIANANEALKRGEITVKDFLRRVTYKETKLCDNFLNFEDLSTLDLADELTECDELTEDDDVVSMNANESGGEAIGDLDEKTALKSGKCIGCVTADSNCVHLPCGHCLFCMDCFDTWDKKDTEFFGLIDNPDEELSDDDDPSTPTPTKCPYCKVTVDKVVQLFRV